MTLNILTSILMLSCPFGGRVDLNGIYEYPLIRDQVELQSGGRAIYTAYKRKPESASYNVNAITGEIVILRQGKKSSSLYVINNALYMSDPRKSFDGGIQVDRIKTNPYQSQTCIMSDSINKLFPTIIS